MTEPGAGSDVAGIKTTAAKKGDSVRGEAEKERKRERGRGRGKKRKKRKEKVLLANMQYAM